MSFVSSAAASAAAATPAIFAVPDPKPRRCATPSTAPATKKKPLELSPWQVIKLSRQAQEAAKHLDAAQLKTMFSLENKEFDHKLLENSDAILLNSLIKKEEQAKNLPRYVVYLKEASQQISRIPFKTTLQEEAQNASQAFERFNTQLDKAIEEMDQSGDVEIDIGG